MMKKIINLLLVLVFVFSIVGCFGGTEEDTFEIVSYPTSTYAVGTQFDWSGLIVKVNGVQYTKEQATSSLTGIEFPDLGVLSKEGTYTATISYQGLKASFQYTVVTKLFAGGNGTKENPYQIATKVQFLSILNEKNNSLVYYEFINDIDLGDYNVDGSSEGYNMINVSIDGKDHALRGVKNLLWKYFNYDEEEETAKPNAEVILKNIKVFYDNALLGLLWCGYGKIKFDNVDTFGTIISPENNLNAYAIALRTGEWTFINCQNYADILGFGRESAAFIGQYPRDGKLYLINSQNYGTITGLGAAAVIGNGSAIGAQQLDIIIDNKSANFGKIITSRDIPGEFIAVNNGQNNSTDIFNTTSYSNVKVYKYEDGKTFEQFDEIDTIEERAAFHTQFDRGDIKFVNAEGLAFVNNEQKLLQIVGTTNSSLHHYKVTVKYWSNKYINNVTTGSHGAMIVYESNNLTTASAVNSLGINLFGIKNQYNTATVTSGKYTLPSDAVITPLVEGHVLTDSGIIGTTEIGDSTYFVLDTTVFDGYAVAGYVEYTVSAFNSDNVLIGSIIYYITE